MCLEYTQTDRRTDRKWCIWAHRANCTGGLNKKLAWPCAPWCITPKMVHNMQIGAQLCLSLGSVRQDSDGRNGAPKVCKISTIQKIFSTWKRYGPTMHFWYSQDSHISTWGVVDVKYGPIVGKHHAILAYVWKDLEVQFCGKITWDVNGSALMCSPASFTTPRVAIKGTFVGYCRLFSRVRSSFE